MRQTKFSPAGSAMLGRLLLGTSLSTLGFAPCLAQAQTDARPEQIIVTAALHYAE